jgi:hypothetical protein
LASYLALAALACSGDLRETNAARAEWHGAWIDTVPVVRLGGEIDLPLFQVRGAVLAGDTIIVAERSTGKIHFFNRTGEFLKSVGGLGQGPGEFDWLLKIQKQGEDLYAHDPLLRRVSQFASDGSFIRSVRIDPEEEYSGAVLAGVFADRSFLVAALAVGDRRVEGIYRLPAVLFRYDSAGTYVDSLYSYLNDDSYSETTSTYGYGSQVPFGRRTISLASGSHYYVIENSDYGIGLFHENGTKVRELRPPQEPRVPVSPQHLEAIRRYWGNLPGIPDPVAAKMRRVFDRIPKPDTFPPYGWYGGPRVQIASASSVGDLWVLNGGELPAWTVFKQDGALRGHVRAFEEIDVLDADDEVAVVLHWDELDVETVEVRRIRR